MYYKILYLISLLIFQSFTAISQHKDNSKIIDKGQPLPIILTDETAIDTTYSMKLSAIDDQEGGVVPIFQVIPKNPIELPKTNKPIKVWLKGLVNSTGRIVKAIVLKSDNVILNKPALRALIQWKFGTGFEDTTMGLWVAVHFRFSR